MCALDGVLMITDKACSRPMTIIISSSVLTYCLTIFIPYESRTCKVLTPTEPLSIAGVSEFATSLNGSSCLQCTLLAENDDL